MAWILLMFRKSFTSWIWRWIGDGLGDLVDVVDDLDAVLTQHAGEVVMLFLRDLEVGHIVEQQTLERSGRQRLQLLARAMQQDLIELTDL